MTIPHIFSYLLLLPVLCPAQNDCCCCIKREIGQNTFDKGLYQEAISRWKEGKRCSDFVSCNDLDDLIERAQKKIKESESAAAIERERRSAVRQKNLADKAEEEFWEIVSDCLDPQTVRKYIEKYPDGRFRWSAEQRIRNLEADIENTQRLINELKLKIVALDSERVHSQSTVKAQLKKLDEASIINVTNIEVDAVRFTSSGKEKKVKYAYRVEKLNVCFNTVTNEVTAAGEEIFYIRIEDPTGAPLVIESLGSGVGQNKRDESEFRYTTTAVCNYSNGVTQVCGSWQPGQAFVSGNYKLEIYNKGYLVGTSSFKLWDVPASQD